MGLAASFACAEAASSCGNEGAKRDESRLTLVLDIGLAAQSGGDAVQAGACVLGDRLKVRIGDNAKHREWVDKADLCDVLFDLGNGHIAR